MLGANLDFRGANRVFAWCIAPCARHGVVGSGGGVPPPVGGSAGGNFDI